MNVTIYGLHFLVLYISQLLKVIQIVSTDSLELLYFVSCSQ